MTPALSRVFPVPLYFFSSPTYSSDADIRSEFAANVLEQLSGMLPENAELEVHLIDSDTTADIHSTTAIDRTSEIAFFVPLSGSTQPWMLSVSRHHRYIVLINAYLPGFFSAELQAQIMHDNAHPACADYYARMRRDTKSIVWISNSKSLSSVWFAWQASQRVKNARILRIGETEPWLLNSCRDPETFREKLGTEIIPVELDALYASIHELEQDTVESDAESWVSGATSLVGVDASDILKATNVTRALEQMVSSHRADGLSIACFAMIGALDTTSCLAMSKFNDSSDRIGACEGDLDAAITMLLLKGLGAEFVWIGNPIIQDTWVDLVHCTAPRCACGSVRPYRLMRHHESGRGVSPEVKLPTGDVVSLVRIGDNLEKVVIHTGKATIPEKLPACRTQIRVHIKDTKRVRETLMGAHMIMTYGDYSEKISYAAVFLGLELL